MSVVTIPDSPSLGIPVGMKQAGQRVDFRVDNFDLAIETKGYLLLWERSIPCPCSPVVAQTEQPDPNCDLCKGVGWVYFGASESQMLTYYTLTELQQYMLENSQGMIIRGLVTSVTNKDTPFDIIGRWQEGSANLTVRHENRVGYYDKITSLDSQIIFSEVLIADGSAVLPTRYPVIGVNHARSITTEYKCGADFVIENGEINWYSGSIPVSDMRISVHYLCHPVWLIVEHPHATRVTSNKLKTSTQSTPTGEAKQLPIQAMMRYDFLPYSG